MNPTKPRILFVTKHAVHAAMAMAGNQVFYHTLLDMCKDGRLQCGFVTVQKKGEDLTKMKSTFGLISADFSLAIPAICTFFTHLFYHSFLRMYLSLFRPDWYLLDPIYRFYFKKAIKRAKEQGFYPDVVVLEWTEVLFLAKFCKKIFPRAKIVATEHDVTFTRLGRKFRNKDWIRKRLAASFREKEIDSLNNIDLVRVLSRDDRQTLVKHHIAPDKIRLAAPYFQKKNLAASANARNQVVFYGALNRSENREAVQWFIEKVFRPFQLRQYVSFVVVGGGNARLKEQYSHVDGVQFMGYVEDPASIFVESLCMVVPLVNGGGIKIKVLEGMTCSLPVLANEIGMEGIGGEDGVEFIYCKTPKEYEQAIKALVERPLLRWTIGNHAREWVNEHFDYQKDLEAYKTELLQLCKT